MNKRTRLIILLVCVVLFLLIAPLLVAYSMGYRFDFEKMKVVATGGIYVRTFPAAGQIIIDSNISEKPGLFANSIFVQSLLPKNHTVSIKKDGYYDYFKTLPVQENQVTKIENVFLIKKLITFSDVSDKIDYFSISPNNQSIITASTDGKNTVLNYFSISNPQQKKTFSIAQTGNISDIKWTNDSSSALIEMKGVNNDFYYFFDSNAQKPTATRLSYLDKNSQQISFSPQDSQIIYYIKDKKLYSAKGNSALPIINNVISFKISGSDITWLSSKGTLYDSDLSGKLIAEITSKDFAVDGQKTYDILFILQNTFLKENNTLFKLNQNTKIFEKFDVPLTDYKIITSSDNKNLIFWSSEKIYLYSLAGPEGYPKFNELFSGSQINDCQWLNNDYIIFTAGDKIIISEIDYRGNINAITFPEELNVGSDKTLKTQKPQIFFVPQDGKLYVLTQNTLLSSEKITP